MTRQVLKVNEGGKKFSVVFHEGDKNPYWIYRHTWGVSGAGYAERKRIEVKYADFASCMYYLTAQF